MPLTFLVDAVAPVFYKLLYMSITALVIGMVVILVRRFADRWFSPFWKYAMWLLVLAALLLPWRPQSNFALMNTTAKVQEVSFRAEYLEAQAEYEAIMQKDAGFSPTAPLPTEIEAKAKTDALYTKTLVFDGLLPALWLCGVALTACMMFVGGLRLGRKIKAAAIPFETGHYERILQSCKEKLGIRRQVGIMMQGYVKTPALFGLFRPKIILPAYVESMSDTHLEYVVLHELSHLKRGDALVNLLLLALQTVYWFNPLTWFLFRLIREDMELANDAAVLKGMGKEEQKEYSLSLVEVLAGYGRPNLGPRLLSMVDSEKNMTRRIQMIKLGEFFKKRRLITALAAIAVIAVTAALFLTAGTAKTAQATAENGQNALLSSLGYHDETLAAIEENQTPYIGDNSKVGAIVSRLPITWQGLSYDSFALQTDGEPYGLTVHYKETAENAPTYWYDNPFAQAMEENNALLLFAAVDNLSEITFAMPLGMESTTFSRAGIGAIFNGIPPIADRNGIYEKLGKNMKMDEFYFAHAERLYLLDAQPENLTYLYGAEPDQRFSNQKGLTVYEYAASSFYFDAAGLYATRELHRDEQGSYTGMIAKFGLPASEKTVGKQTYIFYRLRQAAPDEPEKYAYFVCENDKVIASGRMIGDDASVLNRE